MEQIPKLGEILIGSGVITPEKLSQALKYQAQNNCMLGEALVKLGFASEESVAMNLAMQLGIPYASRENKILSPEKNQDLDKLIGEKFARDNVVVPLFIENNTLAVAMVEPTNVLVIDNLKIMTNMEIQPFIATKAQILKVVDSFYQSHNLIEQAMEDKGPGHEDSELKDIDVFQNPEDKLDLDKMVMGESRSAQSIRIVNAILKQAISERASDIHLELFDESVSLRFRIDGTLYERTPPPKDLVNILTSRVKILSRMDISEKRLPQDGNFAIKYQNRIVEIRVSVCPTVFGEKLVLRILDKGQVEMNIDKLGFEAKQKEDFLKAAAFPHGLILLTGPTGCGKTTTLNAVLNTIKTPEYNFMTLEDPVEFKISGISQVQIKPQIGLTFATGLRSFLRQDPDVILVGEVRDQETAEACLRAALTGHLVFSTLHTNDSMGVVPRLIDMGMEPFLLSNSLILVAAQRLMRILCPHCKIPYRPDAKLMETALSEGQFISQPDTSKWVFYKAQGCEKCSKTGFLGRKATFEVFTITEEMRNIIYKTQNIMHLREAAKRSGAWNLRASGWHKVTDGLSTVEEVMTVTLSME
ncbi:MAG: ATPase, T2SS/T4P/T4SS family [Elusimicrobia bacterium]|nr:ATPase, T2SS/T4P/T4SS family [Elusimicrobiota bacterium]